MKILLVGNHSQDSVHSLSMDLFSRVLCTGLQARGNEVILARPKSLAWALTGDRMGMGKWSKYLDQFIGFPPKLRKLARWADIVHITDHSNATLLSWFTGKPCVVTCHDTIGIRRALGLYREERASRSGKLLQAWTAANLHRADRIACVSRTVARELRELVNIDEDRLEVVSNGLNYRFHPMETARADGIVAYLGLPPGRPFILHVGSGEWKKNRAAAIEIFAALKSMGHPAAGHLVFVGAPADSRMKQRMKTLGIGPDVSAFGQLPSEVLCALYSKSSLFVFPSLYEGFGWPIIEAQASGALVATSDRDPMREVAGNGAILIDPENPIEAARVIAGLTEADRDATRGKGMENALRYTPEIMLAGYETLYRSTISFGKSCDG